MSRLIVLWHFYRNFLVITVLVDFIGCLLIMAANSISYAMLFTLVKLAINLLTGLLFHIFRKETLYYYNNLGYSTAMAYTSAMLLDLILWSFSCLILVLL